MKILWIKSNFLDPRRGGGHIRTFEILRRLRRNNVIHYVAFQNPGDSRREHLYEYCDYAHPVALPLRRHGVATPWLPFPTTELPRPAATLVSGLMQPVISQLTSSLSFDQIVCDFPFPAVNIEAIGRCTVFAHNVESVLAVRFAKQAETGERGPLLTEARRTMALEKAVYSRARHVIAVSLVDANRIARWFGVRQVSWITTGVDSVYLSPPAKVSPYYDMVFLGSMDWGPNRDAIVYFVNTILPLIRHKMPGCSLAVVGREPPPDVLALARRDGLLTVTGTVPDVRPWLWRSRIAIVPLRIGGGTRLKIYEAMAAGVAVVSTSVGAEGLTVRAGAHLAIADTPGTFAEACTGLLADAKTRAALAEAASLHVRSSCTWDAAAEHFAEILARLQSESPSEDH